MNKCLIHYFSGTGNTYHMVKIIEHQLKESSYKVELLNIEKDDNKDLTGFKLHIFCYPIYGFGTPAIILKYISKLQRVKNCRAALIASCAGFEGQSLYHLKFLLSRKGFDVFLSDFIVHTYNWTQVLNPPDKEREAQVFKRADEKTIELVRKITDNDTYVKRQNILALALSWIVFTLYSKVAHKILGKTFIADSSCIHCGKCRDSCPVKAINIKREGPKWNWNCETCQRCINICPCRSIQLSIAKLILFAALEIAPIFILISINKHIYRFYLIVNILIYCIMFILGTLVVDKAINIMEANSVLRKVFEISYTKKYRRNIAKDYKGIYMD